VPTTVTASNGDSFHLWQLPPESTPEPTDVIQFDVLQNELSSGFRSSILIGSNTGRRSWQLSVPTLAGGTVIAAALTSVTGATVSREDYLRTLYAYNRTTGIPFVYQENGDGQYYLVDFADEPLSMQKMKGVDIYSTTVELRQRRIHGVTVFNPARFAEAGLNLGMQYFNELRHVPHTGWKSNIGSALSAQTLTVSGSVNVGDNSQNGLPVVRFSGGKVTHPGLPASDIFLAMKMRESTLSTSPTIVNTSTGAALSGTSGQTKFTTVKTYEYRLDGTLYPSSNMVAPMNEWGVVHIHSDVEFSVTEIGSAAVADIAEIIVFENLTSVAEGREIGEYLRIKWGF
jgi:hypothetical protein